MSMSHDLFSGCTFALFERIKEGKKEVRKPRFGTGHHGHQRIKVLKKAKHVITAVEFGHDVL